MDYWKTNLSLYKLAIGHLREEPNDQEELFIKLMYKDTQSMAQI